MQVVAEEPWNWFLFEDGGILYLEVLVEHGAISFDVAAELSTEQKEAYERHGVTILQRLSGDMRHKALTGAWHATALPSGWAERSVAAVHEWQKRRVP